MVADELVTDDEARPVGVPHELEGGVQPSDEVMDTRVPPTPNRACILVFCPAVNMFIQPSSV